VLLFFAHRGLVSAASKTMTPDHATVHLQTADGGTDAFVAMPAGEAPAPAVIVIHEYWGLNPQIEDVARQLARQGYVAIVPDLYHGKVAETPEDAHELMRGLEDTRVFSELDAARAWLTSQPRTAKSRVGIMGFCMGGGISLRYGLRTPSLAAVVMFYGPPETDPEKLATLRAPLMGHFGAEDQGITPERVSAFRAALAKAGKPAQVFEYSGAGHAFMHEGQPSYRADAARVAWARTLAFLQKHLKS
jgi:carboxymethylenebutenolidase